MEPVFTLLDGEPGAEGGEVPGAVKDAAAEIIAGAPEPSEHAIAAAQASASTDTAAAPTGATDSAGVAFDPAKHATGRDGNGVKKADGTWRNRRGVKPGSTVATPRAKPGAQPVTGTVETRAEIEAKARSAGIAAAGSVFMLGQLMGGREWAPVSSKGGKVSIPEFDEAENMEKVFSDYFIATGRTDFPPGIGLAVALLGYVLPRLRMPETKERVRSFKERIAHWWVSRKIRKAEKASGARSDSRNDSQRKDHASTVASGGGDASGAGRPRT